MPAKALSTIRSEVVTQIVTNTSRSVTGNILQARLTDLIDALRGNDAVDLVEDFIVSPNQTNHPFLRFVTSGTGASITVWSPQSLGGHCGGVTLSTGTSSTGQANIYGADQSPYSDFGFITLASCEFAEWGAIFATPDTASDGTNDYRIIVGPFGDHASAVGAGLTYRHSENGGRWQGVCTNAATTTVDTGVAFSPSAWINYKLRWQGGVLKHYINGTQVGGDVSTNIPTVMGGAAAAIRKQAGTTARSIYLDKLSTYAEVTR